MDRQSKRPELPSMCSLRIMLFVLHMRICTHVCYNLLSCRIDCKILISLPRFFDCTYSVFSLWQPPVQSGKILDLWCVEWRAGDHLIMILWLTLQVAFSLLTRRQRTWWRWPTAKWQVPLSPIVPPILAITKSRPWLASFKGAQNCLPWIWSTGFLFWYKKTIMPKKKVIAARNLQECLPWIIWSMGFLFWYKKTVMPKRKLLLHGTLKNVYQVYHSKQEK